MNNGIVIGLFTLLVIGAVIGTGYAVKKRFCEMTPAERADRIEARIVKELNLTPDQKVKLDAMKAEVLDKVTQLHADKAAMRGEVIALVKNDRIAESDVNALIEKKEAKWRELKPVVVNVLVDFHNMLTPEQRNKLAEKMETSHNRCGHFE